MLTASSGEGGLELFKQNPLAATGTLCVMVTPRVRPILRFGQPKSTIHVTDLTWKGGLIRSFMLFVRPQAMWDAAWKVLVPLFESGAIKPIVARTFPLTGCLYGLKGHPSYGNSITQPH